MSEFKETQERFCLNNGLESENVYIKGSIQIERSKNQIDWEQRRYEVAKDAMSSILSKPSTIIENEYDVRHMVSRAIRYADEFINELRK